MRRNRAQGLALVLDVDSFADEPGSDQQRAQHELAAQILRDNQWRVVEVSRGHERRRRPGPGACERATCLDGAAIASCVPVTAAGIAVMISVALATFTLPPLTTDGSFLILSWLLIGLIGGTSIVLRRLRIGGGTVLASPGAGLAALLARTRPGQPEQRRRPGTRSTPSSGPPASSTCRPRPHRWSPNDGTRLIFVTVVGVIMIMTDLLVSGISRPAWAIAPPATLFLVPALGLGTDTGVVSFLLIAVGYLGILVAEGLNTTARWTRGLARDSAEGFGEATPVVWRAAAYLAVPALVTALVLAVAPADAVAARLRLRHRGGRRAVAADRPDPRPAAQPEPGDRPAVSSSTRPTRPAGCTCG